MPKNEPLLAEVGITLGRLTKELARAEGRMLKTAKKMEAGFEKSNLKSSASFRHIDAGVRRTSFHIQGLQRVLIGALSVREIQAFSDAWTVANNKLAASSQISGLQARSLSDLNDIASETRSGITETVDLYTKLLRATKGVAKSELEVARATEIVNKAFKAGGAAASEQNAGILQLGQGLSSGVLQGDELRSIRENAPLIAQAIANEFETTIGGLKQLGADGELVASRVFRAILNAGPEIEAAFAKTNSTIGEGFTRLRNSLTEYIGVGNDSVQATAKIAASLEFLADNINLVIAAGSLMLGRFLGPVLLKALSQASTHAKATSVALKGLSTGARVTAVSVGVLSSGLALLGGGTGLVLAALTTLPLLLSGTNSEMDNMRAAGDDATEALRLYAEASQRANEEQGNLAGGISRTTRELLEQSRAGLQDSLKDLKETYASALDGAIIDDGWITDTDFDSAIAKLAADVQDTATYYFKKNGGVSVGMNFNLSDNALGGGFQEVFDALSKFKDGSIGAAELVTELNRVAGAGAEVGRVFSELDLAASEGTNTDRHSRSVEEVLELATVIGGLDAQISAFENATGVEQKTAAFAQLRTVLENTAITGALMRTELNTALRGVLNDAGLTEIQVKEVTAALGGTVEEIQAAKDRLDEATQASLGLANAGSAIDFSNATASASALANELQRAVNAAVSLASQGVASEERARINYEFRDDPKGRAGALAGSTFDERVEYQSDADIGSLTVIHEQREAYVAAAIEAENYRQKTIAANKATSGGGGSSGGGSGGGADDKSQRPFFEISDQQIERLNQQISLIGLSAQSTATLTAKTQLLAEAKKRGLDLEEIQRGSNRTLREEIDEHAAAIGRLTQKQHDLSDRHEFWNGQITDLKTGLIDAIVEGENFEGVLANIAKAIAKAALQAALFNEGPLKNLFGLGGGLFGGGSKSGKGKSKGGLFGGAIIPGILHSGGTAGVDGYDHGRAFPASTWDDAQRYHTGGIAGLRSGEVPAILEQGETILPKGTKFGSGGRNVTMNINISGANGDKHVMDLVSQGVSAGMQQVRGEVPEIISEHQLRFG